VDKIQDYADNFEMSLLEAMFEVSNVPGVGRAVAKVEGFTDLIMEFRNMLRDGATLTELYDAIIERTGYWDELVAEGTDEAEGRMENLNALKDKIATYEDGCEYPDLSGLLEEIALVADVDSMIESEDKVLLMTLHSAKGLEFPCVFLVGMEDRLFPSGMAMDSDDPDALGEERRLCYVGITRAKEQLFLSAARQRMMRGTTNYNAVSRFVKEIPEDVIKMNGNGSYAIRKQNEMLQQARSSIAGKSASVTAKPYSYGGVSTSSKTNVPFGKEFKVERLEVDYAVGDTVLHVKFGKGVVTALVSGGKDYEVTVDFENVGTKRMFASFAKLKKVQE